MDSDQHDEDAELKQAMALSLQAKAEAADADRREEQQLQAALELSLQQGSDALASPSAVQLRLPQTYTAASARPEQMTKHLAPMRSWFSVPVPDVAADLPMIYPSPLRRAGSRGAASASPVVTQSSSLLAPRPEVHSGAHSALGTPSVAGLTSSSALGSRSSSRFEGNRVEQGVGTAAAIAACLAGTWTDWGMADGAIKLKPDYCITIQPLDGQSLFGVHIVLLEQSDGHSMQQIVRASEGGIEVVEGEAAWGGLTAELE